MTTATQSNPLPVTMLEGDIACISLEHPDRPLVVLDQTLLGRLNAALDQLPKGLKGVLILSGDPKVFVAGADLKEIDALSDDQLHSYLTEGARVFSRLADLPCPSVALINGAALGGGLELALHCSAIVAARTSAKGRSYPIGLPEASLGLCPAWGGTQLLPGRIDPQIAIEATAAGRPFTIDAAPEGLIDAWADTPDELLQVATDWLNRQTNSGTKPPTTWIDAADTAAIEAAVVATRQSVGDAPAALAVCEAVTAGVTQGHVAGLEAERRLLVALRNTDDTRARLKAFLEGQR